MSNLDLQDKKVAILGLGIEGMALLEFLKGKVKKTTILDQLPELKLFENLDEKTKSLIKECELEIGEGYLDNLSNFDIVFRSPGISLNHPKLKEARDSGVIISSQIKLFFKLCPATIIGVTGTKGKGTTSSLIYEIVKKNLKFLISNLKSNPNDQMTNGKINDKWEMKNDKLSQVYLAGNIGYPAITLIPKLKSDDIVILELSSFQLMDMDKSPHIAIVTNLSVDHLDYHEDEDEYQFAKINILKFQDNDDYAVLNSDSTFGLDILNREVKSKIKYFSHTENKDATVKNDQVILDPKNRSITICDKKDIKLFGRHNLENIAAASIVADILGITPKVTSEVASQFKGLPHRLELVQEINGVKYINDSYATNPEPTIAAINSFPENKILILGGSSKGANFDDLSQIISKSNVSTVSLIGVEGQKIKNSLLKNGFKGKIISGGDSINEIVSNAKRLAKPGDVVIFSPACASFDMFKNYKDRGEKFKTEVLNLISKS